MAVLTAAGVDPVAVGILVAAALTLARIIVVVPYELLKRDN